MLFKEFEITVDLEKSVHNPVYSASTGDWQSLKLIVNVQKSGQPVDLTGITPRLAIRKADKSTVFQEGVALDEIGKCEFILSAQAYAVGGTYKGEVMLFKDAVQIAVSSGFTYMVSKGILDIELESTDYWPALAKAIEAGGKEPLRQEAETERQTAEETRLSNESVREVQEATRQANEAARQETIALAEQVTSEATTAAQFANEQGNYAKAEYERLKDTDVSKLSAQLEESTH